MKFDRKVSNSVGLFFILTPGARFDDQRPLMVNPIKKICNHSQLKPLRSSCLVYMETNIIEIKLRGIFLTFSCSWLVATL